MLTGLRTPQSGTADVYLDGARMGIIDFYAPSGTHDNALWHTYGLPDRAHTLKVVVRGRASPRSAGEQIIIYAAIPFRAK